MTKTPSEPEAVRGTNAEDAVFSAVATGTWLHGRIHETEVIEGIERRARFWGQEAPSEQSIRDAIASLLERGRIARDAEGWLTWVRKSA